MQGAKPIMISPDIYSEFSFRKIRARRNIKKGPKIHVMKKESESSFGLFRIECSFVKSTFTRGGYIIIINPIASGIFVVLYVILSINVDTSGTKYPIETPTAIAKKIHKVKN
jgi:hypothetical protein